MKGSILYIGNKLAGKGRTPTGIDTLGPLLEQEGYTLYYASAKSNKFLRLFDMTTAVIKKSHRVDYVLIDTYSTANFWYAMVSAAWCILFKLPYIPILRGGRLPDRLANSARAFQFLMHNAHTAIAPSDYIFQAVQDAGYTNIKCIPNNIRLEEYSFKHRKTVKPHMLWVRAFAEIYNPLLALKVLKRILQQYPDASLCMVGPDKDGSRNVCENYAQKHKLPVVFTGNLTKRSWCSLSTEYDIFLNTTHFDNMPVSMIEAMALGLPVVSTNVGGVSYLAKDQKEAILVADNDEDAFVKGIFELIEEPEKASELALAARERITSFDWNIIKQKWFNLLN